MNDSKDTHFLEQFIVHDHFDAGQRERFRYEHCRFVSFLRSRRVGELLGVVPTAGFRRDA